MMLILPSFLYSNSLKRRLRNITIIPPEVMCSDERRPKINMIREPRRLLSTDTINKILHISNGTETIYECDERDWRAFCGEE